MENELELFNLDGNFDGQELQELKNNFIEQIENFEYEREKIIR